MKRIYKNSDIKINLKTISGLGERFIIKFYTVNKNYFIKKTDEDVIVSEGEKYLKLNWNELETIGDGVLNYVVNNIADDSDYDDGIYNNTFSKTTNYYINSNLSVEQEGDTSISEPIADLSNKLDEEITRSTNKDTEHDTAISDLNDDLEIESDARGAADLTLQANIDAETTARQNADSELQTSITNEVTRATNAENDLYTGLTNETSDRQEEDVRLNNLITAETSRATAKENEIDAKFADYETISDHNSDMATINESISSIEEDVARIDEVASGLTQEISGKANIGDSYTKAESDAKYLTKHQDISALATKTELNTVQTNLTTEIENETARAKAKENSLSGKIYDIEQSLSTFGTKTDHDADIDTLDGKISSLRITVGRKADAEDVYTKAESDAKYLTEHQDISNLATKTELQSEATARQNADTTLQNNIDTLSTSVTTLQTNLDEKELVVSASLNELKSNKADKEDLKIIDCGEY